MGIQSFELLNPATQEQLGRTSFEERMEIQADTVSIEDSKSIAQEEEKANMNGGKRRVIKKQGRGR